VPDRNPELRQKPSVADGVLLRAGTPESVCVVYEPGNGSRYVLHIDELIGSQSPGLQQAMGWSTKRVLVVDLLQGTATTLGTRPIDPARLAKELQRSGADGIVLAELIAHVIGGGVQAAAEHRPTGLVELAGVCGRCGNELRHGHKCRWTP
jgi:hypothetical protein